MLTGYSFKMPFKTSYHNVSPFGEKMVSVFVLPQSFGHYKFSHSTRREEFLLSRFVFRTFPYLPTPRVQKSGDV